MPPSKSLGVHFRSRIFPPVFLQEAQPSVLDNRLLSVMNQGEAVPHEGRCPRREQRGRRQGPEPCDLP